MILTSCSRYMKKSALFFLLIMCLAATTVFAQFKSTGKTKAHPFLFYTPNRIQHLKERMKKDTMMARNYTRIKDNVDKAVVSGKANLEELSFIYSITGEKKYAEAVKQGLLQLVTRKQWDGLDDRTPRWNSALGTAHNNFMAATAFDAVYNYLSNEERFQIAQGIVKLGIEPSLSDWISPDKRLHSLNSMGHNWWSSIVYQAGVASLAVMNEVPEARDWAEDVMLASNEWFAFSGSVLENKPANFDPSGGFYESVSYANFGVSEYLLFRLAWTNAFEPIKMPYDHLLEKTMDWFINASYPNSGQLQSVNFGDSNPFANGDRPVKIMIALGYDQDRYRWYLNETGKGSVKEDMGINTPLGLLYQPDQLNKSKVPDLPTASIYQDMGWAMLRSSWNHNATMLGVKSGYTWNHAHADAGSFILYHNGKNLLADGGNVNYGNPSYSSYSVRSEAHNVVLFNGKAQNPQDQYHAVKNIGRLYNLMDAGDFKYLLADATGPTSQYFLRNYRNFVWVGNVILVIDDVKAYETGKFEWLLHFNKDAKKKGIDLEVTNDSAAVLVRPLFPETLPNGYPHDFPEKMRLDERTGVKDHDPDTKVTYYSIYPPEEYKQTKFINAIILLDDKNKPITGPAISNMASAKEQRTSLPRIEKLEGLNWIGVRITERGKVTDVYVNLLADGRLMHRNSHNVMGGWETDAYMMAITYPEKAEATNPDNISEYFVSNGSYVRKDAKVVLHSLSKVFMHAKMGSNTEVLLQGQPLIYAKLGMNAKPATVVLNHKKIKTDYLDKEKMLVLQVEARTAENDTASMQ
ncbi:heparinase II/III family protein [Chitinophagaceae bacterium LB-8]|uniref:Heparinase II/III family protein n=1 Tax=Paraflavisolibacter caeni TaxID=2982496 RepID=A0A9X2Y1C4_9BACT|nr:heparinase II/III family protein [Paraflavisolibacter caeni]MCU7552747.1 heparinase II/III family protein [Paraflavisolibacter caeni]